MITPKTQHLLLYKLLIDKGLIHERDCEIGELWGVSFRQSGISQMLLFDDRLATRVKELLASRGRVIVAIEPIGNLLIVPPILTKTAYTVV